MASSWNWLPPLTGVEVRKNFNKLKSGFDAAHFMGRDTVVVSTLDWKIMSHSWKCAILIYHTFSGLEEV